MNVEATQEALDELTTNFRYNDAILRNMVIRRDEAVTDIRVYKEYDFVVTHCQLLMGYQPSGPSGKARSPLCV